MSKWTRFRVGMNDEEEELESCCCSHAAAGVVFDSTSTWCKGLVGAETVTVEDTDESSSTLLVLSDSHGLSVISLVSVGELEV